MGTLSTNKLGGLLLMVAPVFTLVFYFLQPGGSLIDTADPADGAATIAAMISNSGLGQVVSVLIPIGLLSFVHGITILQGSAKSGGSLEPLSRIGVQFVWVGVIGWVIGSGMTLAITGSGFPAEQAVPLFGSLYSATVGLGTVAGIIVGIGFLLLALAISTRGEHNKIAALVAAVAAVVAIIVTIIGGMDTSQLQNMTQITGVIYLVHMVWFIMMGLTLIKSE